MQPPIKIAVIIASLRTGGKEKMVLAILNHLDRQQFDPFLCVMNEGELLEQVENRRIYAPLAYFRGDILGYAWRLWRILRAERPQIIYCLSYRIPAWVSRLWGKLLGVPVIIYELHGVEKVGERDLELPDRLIFDRMTDHMIAIGEEFRQNLLRDGVDPAKITVIRNGIDTEKFHPQSDKAALKTRLLGLPPDAPLIGCITKMRPKKNLPMLVEAFALIKQSVPKAHLMIVGEGSEKAALEACIQEHRLKDCVHLLGLRHDIPALLNACEVIALSSTTEAAPLVILEAGACGLPVVSTAVGEIADMIIDGETGYLVPSGDAGALADRLTRLLLDTDLRQQMGQTARQHIVANFSLAASIRARETLFLRLLGEKTKPYASS